MLTGVWQCADAEFAASYVLGNIAVTGFLTYIQTNLPLLLTSAGQIIQTLGTGIMTALPQIATSAASIIQTLWNTLTTAAPQLLSVAVSIMQNIATGIAANLPSIIRQRFQY